MFDIGFWELVLIGVIALLVVGPDRLPGIARATGKWAGRASRVVSNMKQEIDRELAAEELKRTLERQQASNPVHEILEETRAIGEELKEGIERSAADVEQADRAISKRDGDGHNQTT